MKKIALTFAIFCVLGSVKAQKKEIFQKKNKFGIRQNETVLVKPKYEKIEALAPNFYAIKKDKYSGVINTNGGVIIPNIYDDITYYGENIFLVKKDDKWGLVNRTNKIILPVEYTDFKFITDDFCEIKKDNKLGLISKYGYPILPTQYDDIEPFITNTFLVELNGKKGILDDLGKTLVPIKYDSFNMMADSIMYSMTVNNKLGLMDSSCKILLDAVYDKIESSPLGLTIYEGNKIGFYTNSGKIINPLYSQVLFFQPEFGLAVVKVADKLAFVTANGVSTPAVYENISRFSNRGIAFVEKSGKLMAINIEGQEMTVQDIMSNQNTKRSQGTVSGHTTTLPQTGPPF